MFTITGTRTMIRSLIWSLRYAGHNEKCSETQMWGGKHHSFLSTFSGNDRFVKIPSFSELVYTVCLGRPTHIYGGHPYMY